ncbi:MAG: hypothetical protein O2892_11065 [Actinomycetota bacterium]|nr:hypothetical protein [Actinomycetota bacterium]MDA2949566.1 hypothetical protein [Actinomycetota bacterium]
MGVGLAVGRGQHSQATGVGGALAVTLGIGAALAASTAIAHAETPDAGKPATTETSTSAGPGTERSTADRTRSPGPRRNLANPAATTRGKTDTSARVPLSRARGPGPTIPAVPAGPNRNEPVIATTPSSPAVIPAAAAAIPAGTAISTALAPRPPVNIFAAQPVSSVVALPSAALATVSGISAALPPAAPAKLPFTLAGMLTCIGRAIESAFSRMLPVSQTAVPQTITTTNTAFNNTAVNNTAAPFFQQADWLWTPIAATPSLAAESATWVSYLSAPGAQRVANLYNYGVTLVSASAITPSTPRYDVGFTKAWGADPFGSYTVALPRGTRVPPGSDSQIAVLDPVTGQAFGIWQAKYTSATDTWTGSWGGRTALNGNGIDQTGSATATGISRAAGVVTAAEFDTAVAANTGLGHALVFSTDIAGPGFVGPAIKSDGANIAGVAPPIPEGYRIQLDPAIDVDAIPGITAGEKVIAKTLQTHGAYVVDQGSARMAFTFETLPEATSTNPGAVYTNAGFAWDYYDMNHIPWSQLRVIAA